MKKKLKDFEIMTMSSESLIEELNREMEKEDYDIEYIKELLHYGHLDVNQICSKKHYVYDIYEEYTLLIKAANLNKLEMVKILLENGADPNVQNNLGRTALMAGLYWDHSQVVQELLNHPNINPNLQNLSNHSNALVYAGSNLQAVQILLECPNIDPNNQTPYGDTALMEASFNGYSQAVREILKHPKTDPNVQNNYGYTALHWASYYGRSQAVEELLKHPLIDPNVQKHNGTTALMLASIEGHSQVIQVLLNCSNINVILPNNDGQTAWDVAKPKIREQFPELKP